MEQRTKQVLIVQDGTFKSDSYEGIVTTYKAFFDNEKIPGGAGDDGDTGDKKAANVEIVKSIDDIEGKISGRGFDIVIFVSVDMIDYARKLRKKFGYLKVFVLVGTDPDDGVYIFPKSMFSQESVHGLLFMC